MSANEKVKWGIISTANIGVSKVISSIMNSAHSEVIAISSRNQQKAEEAASALGIPKSYGSYEAMLADPEIDAVYNPLPNHLHVELTLAAANAGKHVLCEKPMGMNAADLTRLDDCPKNLIIAEAFMVRFHPQWHRVREIVRSGELGETRMINVVFTYHNVDENNVRNMADIGGGSLMDIGCYAITSGRYFFEAEPQRVVSLVDRDPKFGTDRTVSVIADFGAGRQLTFMVSTQAAPTQTVDIIGTKSRAQIIVPFNAPANEATAILVDAGLNPDGHLARREIIAPCDQYVDQAEAFALAVLGEKPFPYDLGDAVLSMRVLDAIFASEKSGGWEAV